MAKTTVAIVFGGRSSEHTISCVTAGGVLSAIDRERFDVIPVGVTRDGAFTLQPDDPELFRMDPDAMPQVVDNGSRIFWPESSATRGMSVEEADGTVRALGDVDVAFPILHGPWGEDGTIQGFFELLGIPYVGNGVLASAAAMDKHFTKSLLAAAGIAVAPWATVTPSSWARDEAAERARVAELGLPLFVKPARAGSSVGVTKVRSLDDLESALRIAWAEDSKAIVESAIVGREVECGVLSGRAGAAPRVSVAGEIVVTGRDFYDFEAKYIDPDAAQLICPTELTAGELSEMQRIAVRAFEAVGGAGLARVDFFFTGTEFVVNELNTMPGFTPISMFPKCWEASGLQYAELITELIELGLETVR